MVPPRPASSRPSATRLRLAIAAPTDTRVVTRTLSSAVGAACIAAAVGLADKSPQPACGVDRWPVKVLADVDAGQIDSVPVESSVAALGQLSIPELVYPVDRRISPHEFRVYRVRAVVERILTESDGDWHLMLRDPDTPSATMIAEIPSPECAANASDRLRFSAARDSLRRVPRLGLVTIEGVAFWDYIHNQRGRARNGIELHPVLRLSRSPSASVMPRLNGLTRPPS